MSDLVFAAASRPRRPRWPRFLLSAVTGGAATLADIAVIGVAVGLLHLPARVANVPALLVGVVIQFVGNRRFAFRATHGPLARQALLFAVVELGALALNAAGFHLVASRFALNAGTAMLARALVTNFVFVCFSYPAWRLVFAPPGRSGQAERSA